MEYADPAVPPVRKRGRPVGADSEQTRRTIVRAAGELVAERGYHAATFQQIAARAGVSRPTLHYYYASREQLYEALLTDLRDNVDDCAAEAMPAGTLLTQLAAFIAGIQRLGAAQPALLKVLVTARIDHHRGAHRHDGAAALAAAVHAFYDAVVVDAVRRGELPPDTDAHAVADLLGALFWGLGFHAGFIGGHDQSLEIARQLFSCLANGLLDSQQPAPVEA
ncbi:TetR/AcrR family transcriptional regulator [Mycobacterium sp. ITM-2016-00317]|uniref:TetR/AcrR family transcriptional regulator n=1 Tax=Mycobacterium sp. ITM-2016-00317 TaxID=2099694 RepID=UPI00287FAD12|nr:TetR/AcrR family transcriptional regulator [Mycobacterium sp. ITM-2016-00317]WNG89956.1 TetR/AcrR family transcriptional regulator [Mycobacterium sp. ITM-2016-00317]